MNLRAIYASFNKGMHSGRDPRLLDPAHCSKAINMTVKGGYWRTRPGAENLTDDINWSSRTSSKNIFEEGKFQGMAIYTQPGQSELHVCVSGNIFRISLDNMKARIANPPSGAGSPEADRVVFQQHNRYMLKQDGVTAPVIIDGGIVRNPVDSELPLGYYMASGSGYLFVSSPDRSKFWVSDHYGGDNGIYYNGSTTNPITKSSYGPLTFNDATAYYLDKGSFAPADSGIGPITSMGFMSQLDRAGGHGPLIVGHSRGIWAYDFGIPRQEWVAQQIGSEVLKDVGSVGHENIVNLNGDMGFKSHDGLRTIRYSRATHTERLQHKSISHELDGWLDHEVSWMADQGSGCVFDRQWFSTAMPEQLIISDKNDIRSEVVHRGLFVHEFNVMTGLSDDHPSVYSGLWTYPGRKISGVTSGVVAGEERMFLMLKTPDGKNELWEQTTGAVHDDGNTRIRTRLDLGIAQFQESDISDVKRVTGGYVSFSDVQGDLELNMKYSFDGDPVWNDWSKISKKVPVDFCNGVVDEDCFDQNAGLFPQSYRRIPLPKFPKKECLPGRSKLRTTGHELRIQVNGTGHFKLDNIELVASRVADGGGGSELKVDCRDLRDVDEDPMLVTCQNDYEYSESVENSYGEQWPTATDRCS